MFEGFFIPGLVSFLLAHLAYIALFRQDAPWFASPRAWLASAVWQCWLYARAVDRRLASRPARARWRPMCWPLPPWPRWRMGGRSGWAARPGWWRWAPSAFMLSDATLAINRFVSPLPHSPVWVLGSYYAAQCLIVIGWLRGATGKET